MSEIKFLDRLEPEVGITVGTRPGIIMLGPVIHEFRRRSIRHFVIHTGQHYSPNMDSQMFADLSLTPPEYRLEGTAERRTHGAQTAAMLEGVEEVLLDRRPCLMLVGGDANTNLAAALAARKLRINVGHIEAGERSFDWRMPEEHNRVMIDHISEHLFVTNQRSVDNLKREAVKGDIHIVGNPIVDASIQCLEAARRNGDVPGRYGVTAGGYAIMTLHREENVDIAANLKGALEGVAAAAARIGMPVLFLAHPRTTNRLAQFQLDGWAAELPGLIVGEAAGYLDFLALLADSRMVFTDSGGVQQEACIHHVPCVTLRENTEWTETLDIGANRLAGCDPTRIAAAAAEAVASGRLWDVPFGDGRTAERIAGIAGAVVDRYRSRS
jgi:UDP-N-acetylglucosamine 2-epimerase (non-hydrolysing)